MISAQKDSKANVLGYGGNLGSAGEIDSESAQNLISKAQVHEVIKGLNVSSPIGFMYNPYLSNYRLEKACSQTTT